MQYFKPEAITELLRSLLDEPPEANEAKPVCVRAYEILLQWGVETPSPKSAQEIRSLDLRGTDVGDQAIEQVAELTNLTRLDLRTTAITDKGLNNVAQLKNLGTLLLQGTQVTEVGVAELQKAAAEM